MRPLRKQILFHITLFLFVQCFERSILALRIAKLGPLRQPIILRVFIGDDTKGARRSKMGTAIYLLFNGKNRFGSLESRITNKTLEIGPGLGQTIGGETIKIGAIFGLGNGIHTPIPSKTTH